MGFGVTGGLITKMTLGLTGAGSTQPPCPWRCGNMLRLLRIFCDTLAASNYSSKNRLTLFCSRPGMQTRISRTQVCHCAACSHAHLCMLHSLHEQHIPRIGANEKLPICRAEFANPNQHH